MPMFCPRMFLNPHLGLFHNSILTCVHVYSSVPAFYMTSYLSCIYIHQPAWMGRAACTCEHKLQKHSCQGARIIQYILQHIWTSIIVCRRACVYATKHVHAYMRHKHVKSFSLSLSLSLFRSLLDTGQMDANSEGAANDGTIAQNCIPSVTRKGCGEPVSCSWGEQACGIHVRPTRGPYRYASFARAGQYLNALVTRHVLHAWSRLIYCCMLGHASSVVACLVKPHLLLHAWSRLIYCCMLGHASSVVPRVL